MLRVFPAAALALIAGNVQASCGDAWYLRNLAFDRAGYCFGSALGEALFDNSDCTTHSPTLSDWDKSVVSAAKRYEQDMGCSVDTTQASIGATLIGKLDLVDRLPVLASYDSMCLGFNGPDLPMRSDLGIATSFSTGDVAAGDTVRFRFEGADGFEFVETEFGAGWIVGGAIGPATCREFAG